MEIHYHHIAVAFRHSVQGWLSIRSDLPKHFVWITKFLAYEEYLAPTRSLFELFELHSMIYITCPFQVDIFTLISLKFSFLFSMKHFAACKCKWAVWKWIKSYYADKYPTITGITQSWTVAHLWMYNLSTIKVNLCNILWNHNISSHEWI